MRRWWKPPQIPTITKIRMSGGTLTGPLVPVRAPNKPMTKEPRTLMSKVPQGNCGPVRAPTAAASQNLAMLPSAPPSATQIQVATCPPFVFALPSSSSIAACSGGPGLAGPASFPGLQRRLDAPA